MLSVTFTDNIYYILLRMLCFVFPNSAIVTFLIAFIYVYGSCIDNITFGNKYIFLVYEQIDFLLVIRRH